MRALVTGASGFLGSWLCKALAEKNCSIKALIRTQSKRKHEALKKLKQQNSSPSKNSHSLENSGIEDLEKLNNIEFRLGDVTDLDSLMEASKGVDVIFHLAAIIGGKKPEKMEKVNVGGTANVIETCQKRGIKLIHMSSVVTIGASQKPCVLNEESHCTENLPFSYFETKRKAEVLVQKACKKQSLSAVILNPSTIYGAGDMRKSSRTVQSWVANGMFPFYSSGGVSVVDVESVVEAILRSVEQGRRGEKYILSGDNLLIKDLFSMIANSAGVKAPFIPIGDFMLSPLFSLSQQLKKWNFSLPTDTMRMAYLYHWFDHSKAKEELNFSPAKASKAIENSVKWFKKQKNQS